MGATSNKQLGRLDLQALWFTVAVLGFLSLGHYYHSDLWPISGILAAFGSPYWVGVLLLSPAGNNIYGGPTL